MTVEQMKQVDIRTVPKSELRDISDITYQTIDDDPLAMVDNLKNQLSNLYVHKRGRVAVCNEYTQGKTINEIFGILIASS